MAAIAVRLGHKHSKDGERKLNPAHLVVLCCLAMICHFLRALMNLTLQHKYSLIRLVAT